MIKDNLSATPPRQKVVPCDVDESCDTVRCAECLKQIPAERAVKSETEDYIRHFCGLGCMHEWERREGV